MDLPVRRTAEQDFARDVVRSTPAKLPTWRRRPITERLHKWVGWFLERQQ